MSSHSFPSHSRCRQIPDYEPEDLVPGWESALSDAWDVSERARSSSGHGVIKGVSVRR